VRAHGLEGPRSRCIDPKHLFADGKIDVARDATRRPHPTQRLTTLALAETRLKHFLALTKPRVVSLIVFCAVIGMFLATPELPPARIVLFATIGIALVAGAAAAINCLVEQKVTR